MPALTPSALIIQRSLLTDFFLLRATIGTTDRSGTCGWRGVCEGGGRRQADSALNACCDKSGNRICRCVSNDDERAYEVTTQV